MAEFTGLNPEEARMQIENFFDEISITSWNFCEFGMDSFIKGLKTAWCSPKAKEFGEKYFPKLYAIYDNCLTTATNICISAVAAYNYLATSNNTQTMSADGFENGKQKELIESKKGMLLDEISPNGVVGMNVAQVKMYLEVFKGNVDTFIRDMTSIRDNVDIAFYDPNGEMKAAYKTLIQKLIDNVTDLTSSMYTDLYHAFNDETDTILLAKDNAVSTMAG